jgi:phycocyanin-associated, rod
MLGRSILASGTSADSRVFVYEVEGLRQTAQTEHDRHTLRSSSTTAFQVPFNRMNEFMQKMHRLGGTIVSVHRPNQAMAHPANHTTPEE